MNNNDNNVQMTVRTPKIYSSPPSKSTSTENSDTRKKIENEMNENFRFDGD